MNLNIHPLLSLLVFPGGLFVIFAGLVYEFIDRKLVARFQNRIGPRWFQPLADFMKFLAKEEVVPAGVNPASIPIPAGLCSGWCADRGVICPYLRI